MRVTDCRGYCSHGSVRTGTCCFDCYPIQSCLHYIIVIHTMSESVPTLPTLGLSIQRNVAIDRDMISLRGVLGTNLRDPWRSSLLLFRESGAGTLTGACSSAAGCACCLPWCIQYKYRAPDPSREAKCVSYLFGAVPAWRMFRMLCMADPLKRNLYEVLLAERPLNMYFDIDMVKPPDVTVRVWKLITTKIWGTCIEQFVSTATDCLIEHFTVGGQALRRNSIKVILTKSVYPDTGCEYSKLSCHIVIKSSMGMVGCMGDANHLFKLVDHAAQSISLLIPVEHEGSFREHTFNEVRPCVNAVCKNK